MFASLNLILDCTNTETCLIEQLYSLHICAKDVICLTYVRNIYKLCTQYISIYIDHKDHKRKVSAYCCLYTHVQLLSAVCGHTHTFYFPFLFRTASVNTEHGLKKNSFPSKSFAWRSVGCYCPVLTKPINAEKVPLYPYITFCF